MSKAKMYRADDWWTGKASLLIGLVYLFTIYFSIPFIEFWKWGALSLITIIGFASLGYWVNDYFDQAKDALAGKKNFLLGKSVFMQTSLFILALLVLALPWYFLPFDTLSIVLIFSQIGCYFLYAIPIVRLKEKGVWGLGTDALYAHVFPTVIAAHTYALIAKGNLSILFLFSLLCWQFFLGIRNVIQHQLNDIESDKKSRTSTYIQTLGYTPHRTLLILKSTELFFLLLLLASLSFYNYHFSVTIVAVVFGASIVLPMHPSNGYKIYFPNILYEQFIPYSFILILVFFDSRYWLLTGIHALLFSRTIVMYFYKKIPFKFYLGRIFLNIFYSLKSVFNLIRTWANWIIFLCFRIIGVDLVKEKTDAKGYIIKHLNKSK